MAEIDNDVIAEATEALPEEELRICFFSIGEEAFAIPVELVTEIIFFQKLFPVPTVPSHVLGVINLRGNIVPVVDIRPALSLSMKSVPGQIAIIKHEGITLGIVVDNVSEVVGVPASSVLAISEDYETKQTAGGYLSHFLTGIIQRENGVAALLNIERVLEAIKLQ